MKAPEATIFPTRLLALLVFAALGACGGDAAPTDVAAETADVVDTIEVAGEASDAIAEATDPTAEADAPETAAFVLLDFESAVALTPDGRTALVWTLATGEFGFYDTVARQFAVKGDVGNPQRDQPTALSATGRVAALHGEPVRAGLWTEAGGWVDLDSLFDPGCVSDPGPPLIEDLGGAFDVSDDGSVAVGLAWDGCAATRAFRWTDTGGAGTLKPLDVLGKVAADSGQKAPYNRATVVSRDGRIAAGFAQNGAADRSPAVWNADGTGFLLDPANESEPGEIKAINADGTRVAGDWSGQGFIWTQATGVVKFTASASAFDMLIVNAMTEDGLHLFGARQVYDPDQLTTTQTAFVWTAAKGVRLLQDVATAAGVTVPATVTLVNVLSVSADGGIVLGTANEAASDPTGFPTQKSFVLTVPPAAFDL